MVSISSICFVQAVAVDVDDRVDVQVSVFFCLFSSLNYILVGNIRSISTLYLITVDDILHSTKNTFFFFFASTPAKKIMYIVLLG